MRAVLFWSARSSTRDALAKALGGDPGLVLAPVGERGELPPDLPQSEQVVIVADWLRLAHDPAAVQRWRTALAPSPVAVLVEVDRDTLSNALLRLGPHEVDDFIEWPLAHEHLALKVRTAFRYLAARRYAGAPEARPSEPGADFREFHRVALALSAESDVNRLLELIVTKCREATCADAGSLYLLEEATAPDAAPTKGADVLRFVVAQNDSMPLDLTRVTLPLDESSIAGYVALTRQPIRLDDAYRPPAHLAGRFNSAMDQALGYRTTSMLVVPMVDHTDKVIGIVQLINKKRAPDVRLGARDVTRAEVLPFEMRDLEMVSSLASLAAVVAVKGRQAEEARRNLEAQLGQSQKMEAVGRLAGGVAHDFNNLLTVIAGRSQLLLQCMAPGNPLRRHVDLIQQTVDRAAAVTRQLLAFSRKQILQPQVLDLNHVVGSSEAILRQLLGEDIALEIVRGAGLGLTKADTHLLEQVIMNLAVNSRDAMPRGGPLTIETANVELDETFVRRHAGARAGRYVTLTVKDGGIGMDAAVRAHVFEPFFTTKEPGKGTGLGLAMVYGIVKQHQGYITVDSKPGCGATFTVYLPRVDEPLESLAHPVAAGRPPRGSETILLAEDGEAVRNLACEILEMHGYTVLAARNGVEALALSESYPGEIALLLTDVVMPEMGGRPLADRLLAARPGIRVLFMSGYTSDAIVHHGVLDPGTVLLPKPFTPASLAHKVREVLSSDPGHAGP